ncbi:DMT family transporter [Sinisalibacter aestuarii]|uniref:Membrane protein n=1 Tax=Sinisalibacter aestuarii TaxID=2949426 RepID=A0ABQ5LUE1_9RHOB|nr:DMT family transporter [Sinisalibacter aestuarii]GKY88598.1 membrane protein [Sinisalibacter aestuarii]
MEPWILATLAAALVQTIRFSLQKSLKGAGLSSGGATFSRFLFAAPLALVLSTGLVAGSGAALPAMGGRFWVMVTTGGLAQIVATMATVALFSARNFAVGIAFTKTETVLVAGFSALVLAEPVSGWGLAAILVGVAGVLFLSVPVGGRVLALFNRASALGLLAGASFGLSAIGYRAATQALDAEGTLIRAAVTLAAVTSFQTVAMALWLRFAEPGEMTRVLGQWRRTALVGVTGMLGSLGWFVAFTLQNAAYVRALGQIELVFSVLGSWLIFGERSTRRELIGIGFLGLSIVMLVLLT